MKGHSEGRRGGAVAASDDTGHEGLQMGAANGTIRV